MPRTPATAAKKTAKAPAAAKTAPAVKTTASKSTAGAVKPTTTPKASANGKTDTEHALQYVPVEQVAPSPDNPRGDDLPDLRDLQHSIREHGILEPLTVAAAIGTDSGVDRYPLIFGHRRLAAARLAGLKVVPVVVRPDLDPRQTAVARLVENLQRVDLTPLEEARGYAQLRDTHKMKQVDIAQAVGRNQGHISKRLSLLNLPDAIATRVGRPADKGGIPIEYAVDVAKLPGAAQVDLVDATHADSPDKWIGADRFATAIRQAGRDAEAQGWREQAAAALRRQKVTVLNLDGKTIGDVPTFDSEGGPAPLHWLRVDDTEHAKGKCHAAVIDRHRVAYDDNWSDYVTYVCTDPASHDPARGAASTAKTAKPRLTKAEKEQQATVDQLEADQAARAAFARELLTRGKLPAETTTYVLRGVVYASVDPDAVPADPNDVAELLGKGDQLAGVTVLEAYTGGDKLIRYALACRLAEDQRTAADVLRRAAAGQSTTWPGQLVAVRLYLGYLEACGWTRRDLEALPDGDAVSELTDVLREQDYLAPLPPADEEPPTSGDLDAAAAAGRVACPDCQGVGRVNDRGDLCATCDGYGVVDAPAAAAPAVATG